MTDDDYCHICGGGCVPIQCERCGKDKQECEAHVCNTMRVFVKGNRNRNVARWYAVDVPPAFFPKHTEDFSAHDFASARAKRAGIRVVESTERAGFIRIAATFRDDGHGLDGLWN